MSTRDELAAWTTRDELIADLSAKVPAAEWDSGAAQKAEEMSPAEKRRGFLMVSAVLRPLTQEEREELVGLLAIKTDEVGQ